MSIKYILAGRIIKSYIKMTRESDPATREIEREKYTRASHELARILSQKMRLGMGNRKIMDNFWAKMAAGKYASTRQLIPIARMHNRYTRKK